MKLLFPRPNKNPRRALKLSTRLPLPPFPVIDDWLKRNRQEREKKRQQPGIQAPSGIPIERPEEKPEERKRENIIPLNDPEQE